MEGHDADPGEAGGAVQVSAEEHTEGEIVVKKAIDSLVRVQTHVARRATDITELIYRRLTPQNIPKVKVK